ncbi:hypothetical protein [Mesorhizobium sp.]|uniref:hypothetical protein n=1 Tax=Mesorhizobium sp. TaxID=1871066 RepID=UPI0035614FF1
MPDLALGRAKTARQPRLAEMPNNHHFRLSVSFVSWSAVRLILNILGLQRDPQAIAMQR